MKRVSIVGFGRFGRVFYNILKSDFQITIYDRHARHLPKNHSKDTVIAKTLKDVYVSDVVFFAVPIASFASVLESHKKYFGTHLLIEVLSVKVHPEEMFKKYLHGTSVRYMLTHPMFGPDSVDAGRKDLPVVVARGSSTKNEYLFWKRYFTKKGFRTIELSTRDHDKLAASSQGVTHFIGRVLDEFGFNRTSIDTFGAQKLHEVEEQTCNDTWELFVNLQNFNPYTKVMRLELGRAFDRLYSKLLPSHVKKGSWVVGIQGGVGSFNHEAALDYTKRHTIKHASIQYLYTTEKVMRYLHKGDIDFGLFAIHNSIGGIVDESIKAIARYKFSIVEEFAIPVRHFLMARRDNTPGSITSVMAHPQALKQCTATLALRHPRLALESGTGDYIDTARVAKSLAEGKLPKTTAVLGPRGLADMYGFKIIDEDLQDQKDNKTSFLLVRRV